MAYAFSVCALDGGFPDDDDGLLFSAWNGSVRWLHVESIATDDAELGVNSLMLHGSNGLSARLSRLKAHPSCGLAASPSCSTGWVWFMN